MPKPLNVALEATRNWYWVYDVLEEMSEEVKLAHPAKISLIAEAVVKTDKIDANIIAHLLRTNFLPTCYVPSKEIRQRRELLRHRAFLIRIRTRVKNRIHALLDKTGIKHPFDDLFTREGIEFLHQLSLEWAYQHELNDLLELLEILNKKEKEQNRIIVKICKETQEAKITKTLPGFGYHNALLVANEIGDVSRFPDGAHYASYCGLVTSVYISDRTVLYGKITKQGNRWLRWIYVEAAHFAARKSYRFGNLYARVEKRSGSKQKAIVAVARELAVVNYYMLKYNKPFNDYYKGP
jgi:transposase